MKLEELFGFGRKPQPQQPKYVAYVDGVVFDNFDDLGDAILAVSSQKGHVEVIDADGDVAFERK